MAGVRLQKSLGRKSKTLFALLEMIKMDKIVAKFTSINEQIEILKKKHLKFENLDFAKGALSSYGYYNIIDEYKYPYIIGKNDQEIYKDGITFERIFSLFELDNELRMGILSSLLLLEQHLRNTTAYVIAESFGTNDSEYLKKEHYKDRKVYDKKFSLDSILRRMKKVRKCNREPIRGYRERHNNVPPWVLVKGLNMNTLVNFIRFQNAPQKEEIIRLSYGINNKGAKLDSVKELYMNSLFVCLQFRNRCAHGGRIYNFTPKTNFRINDSFKSELLTVLSSISYIEDHCNLNDLFSLLQLFRVKDMEHIIELTINKSVTTHCNKYPDDFEYLCEATKLSIDKESN
jgi:abortive infection bacteriophage resistance protein